jgi:hypothetical protein
MASVADTVSRGVEERVQGVRAPRVWAADAAPSAVVEREVKPGAGDVVGGRRGEAKAGLRPRVRDAESPPFGHERRFCDVGAVITRGGLPRRFRWRSPTVAVRDAGEIAAGV